MTTVKVRERMVTSQQKELNRIIKEQLEKSGISVRYRNHYFKILVYILNDFNCQLDIESVDDLLFDLIQQYKPYSQARALWVLSLIDDYKHDRVSECAILPIRCSKCGGFTEFNEVTVKYECAECNVTYKARKEDYWLLL